MTVFITFAPVDRGVAEGLETFVERRGQFAELDDGQTAQRPVQPSDVMVLLLSKDFVFAPTRLRLEQRALDAWSEGRLIVVKLDHGLAPVGLRDLPAIDASFPAQREFKWQQVADAVREKLKTAPRPAGEASVEAPPAGAAKKGGGLWGVVAALALVLPGVAALAVASSIWLVNRIGPVPGSWSDLARGIDEFGARFGAPSGFSIWLFASAIALAVVVLGRAVAALARWPAANKPAAPKSAPPRQEGALFVSYARANQTLVLPVIEAAQQQGRKFWLDQKGIGAGDAWAGEIVRAIRDATGVMVMCSKAAFESDHVKREVYLADRYQKKLTPVFIEQAEAPEDFEYFFAGVQSLNLFETPEADRPQALLRALGATA